ncbi:hypothetical protein BDZ94DRAFT_1241086 [Collybia nuda]|uniref:Uncharacterized protein n=1 Tax=Collybia nuda TaxID=64659 RepID=A0A9P6CDH8_9AGAR|nr:hypothetical protein BDZ94DRAFT_1241086 [Collybia nuda]
MYQAVIDPDPSYIEAIVYTKGTRAIHDAKRKKPKDNDNIVLTACNVGGNLEEDTVVSAVHEGSARGGRNGPVRNGQADTDTSRLEATEHMHMGVKLGKDAGKGVGAARVRPDILSPPCGGGGWGETLSSERGHGFESGFQPLLEHPSPCANPGSQDEGTSIEAWVQCPVLPALVY